MTNISITNCLWRKIQTTIQNLPILILLAYILLNIISFWTAPERELIINFEDDAYYYFKIARNAVEAGKLSFDGYSTTNGFHPLWMLFILPFFAIIKDPILVLRILGTFSIIIVGATGYVSLSYLAGRFSRPSYSLGAALVLSCLIAFGSTGMETTILMPLLLAVFMLLEKTKPWITPSEKPLRLACLGITLALAQLARLDAIFLIIIVPTFILLLARSLNVWRNLIMIGLPSLVSATAYAAFNYAAFGHVVPTSGSAKAMGAGFINVRLIEQLTNIVRPEGMIYLVFLAMLGIAMGYIGFFLIRSWRLRRLFLAETEYVPMIASVFLVAFTAYQLFGSTWRLWRWYTYPVFPMSVFVVPMFFDLILRRLRIIKRLGRPLRCVEITLNTTFYILIAAIGLRCGYWRLQFNPLFPYENYLIAVELNQSLPQPMTFSMGDRAGSFGYFYEGQVLQLEGLVGDYEILAAIKDNNLMDYMTDFGVDFVISQDGPPQEYTQWALLIPSTRHSSGPHATIYLCEQGEYLRHKSEFGTIYIWKWPSCH